MVRPQKCTRERERENITLFHEMVGEVEQATKNFAILKGCDNETWS
jgi:hypothetical protein